jgi:hypothetical protein
MHFERPGADPEVIGDGLAEASFDQRIEHLPLTLAKRQNAVCGIQRLDAFFPAFLPPSFNDFPTLFSLCDCEMMGAGDVENVPGFAPRKRIGAKKRDRLVGNRFGEVDFIFEKGVPIAWLKPEGVARSA